MNIDKKYYDQIQENLKNTLQDTKMNAPNKKVGKVRDAYFLENQVLMVSTDRQSAFDRVLAAIPSVIAYNKFNSDSKKYSQKLENFSKRFTSII